MTESFEVAIIGGGQAGLATSWFLKQANVDHIVLEAGRVGETWRTRRWDSFCLVTPNWTVKLPGAHYGGPDPDGFMALAELIDRIEMWARSFDAPVREGCKVDGLDVDEDGFVLSSASGKMRARTVVVASGAYQRAHRPAGAELIDKRVIQLLAEDYSNPGALPPGAVLVVGSGQTGCQLAEELHQSGRRVFIACGRCPWAPRRMGGHDTVWWAENSGFMDRAMPSPAARLVGNIQFSGHGGGHDLNYRTLHALGVELLGRFAGADDSTISFADDLATSVDFGDARLGDLMKYVEAYCAKEAIPVPTLDWPAPLRLKTRTALDVVEDGISSVIWTTGYRPEYRWVHMPVFDEFGYPIQTDGCTAQPGLYFCGVHWMRKPRSAFLYGVEADAEVVARQIVESRR